MVASDRTFARWQRAAACLSVCLFFLCAASAYAIDTVDMGLLGSGDGLGAIESGRGPHGGYDTTSTKCLTCHSATHNATGDGGANALLLGSTGCEYCHLTDAPGASGTEVYRATDGKTDQGAFVQAEASGHFLGIVSSVPASTIELAGGSAVLTCSTCHAVHGSTAGIWRPADFYGSEVATPTSMVGYKFLRANPSSTWRAAGDPGNTPVPNGSDVAVDDAVIDTAVVNQFALSVWCANCHDAAFQDQQVVLDNGMLSVEDTFTVSGSLPFSSVHATSGDQSIADGYQVGMSHRSPSPGVYTGAAQCYTCHRGGLTADGTCDPVALDGVSGIFADAFINSGKTKCARCHYGYANYAVDANRLASIADFPHSSAGDIKLLGDFSLDAGDPYRSGAIASHAGLRTMDTQQLRASACGRCHVDNVKDSGTLFDLSYHSISHAYPPGWLLNLPLGDILHSPGVGAVSP